MSTRVEILNELYERMDEDSRLSRSRHGQLEFLTTMAYIRRYAKEGSRVLEIGAGTGRYSAALAEKGMLVTAVELLDGNYAQLKAKADALEHLTAIQGDATDLNMLADGAYDLTLVFGPMYHLYERDEIHRAIDEAIRVTKPGGVIMFAFLSVYAIMYANYLYGSWKAGQDENFTPDYKVRHFKEQFFTGYDIVEFESLFAEKPVEHVATAGVDGLVEPLELRPDFCIPDEDFAAFADWYLHFAETRELLGASDHLLYICRKA